MEKRLNKKLDNYITCFKESIKSHATDLEITNKESINQLLQYIYDYERLNFVKEDFQKRKRVKNVVPIFDRCCAKRASDAQCTRRKKEGFDYCGTHLKGTPHGTITSDEENTINVQKIEVWTQEIQGIIYYIDKLGNVYQAEDIVSNKTNPKIIAKYVKNGDNYTIPNFDV